MLNCYDRLMAGMDREFEQALEEVQCFHTWMGEDALGWLRQACAVWIAWIAGEMSGLELLVEAAEGLLRCAEAAGDEVGMWVCGQVYQWAVASARGEEYVLPEVSEMVAGLVGGNEEVPGSSLQ